MAATESRSIAIPDPRAPLTIGQAENIGFVNGVLDEVCIWKRALDATEIEQLCRAGGADGDSVR